MSDENAPGVGACRRHESGAARAKYSVIIPIIVPDAFFTRLPIPAATQAKVWGATLDASTGCEMPDNSDSRHWQRRAVRARAEANRVKDPRSKHRLLRLAGTYETLAEQIEQHTWKRTSGASPGFKVTGREPADSPARYSRLPATTAARRAGFTGRLPRAFVNIFAWLPTCFPMRFLGKIGRRKRSLSI